MVVSVNHTITLEAAALELGVHYQTAYRWVRAGKLPAEKVDGRYHVRTLDLDEVRQRRQEPSSAPPPSDQRLDRQREAMTRALFDGDETKAQEITRTLISNGTPVVRLVEEILAPPLADIGQAWRRGEATIFVEHRATAIVERILGMVAPNPRGRRRGVALVVGVADDRHSLPTLMATTALREDRWTVQHLGADVPVEEIISFIDGHDVDLVVISAVGPGAVERARAAERAIGERNGVPVLVGEPGSTVSQLQELARATRSGRRPG